MTDWLSASAMLLTGVIVGFMFLYGMKRRQRRSDLERADLIAKRDALVARLREDPSDTRLEHEAAEVLRKLDSKGGAPPPSAPAATPPSSALKGFMWGAASVAVLVGIGWFVAQSAKPKEEVPNVPPAVATDTALRDLEQSVQENPENLALRDDLAKAYLNRENLKGVAEQTQYVLQRNPNDARALTYQALVRIAARETDVAAAMLQRATKADPNLIDAWVGMAWLHAQSGNFEGAEAAINEAKRRHPEESQRLDQLIDHLRPAPSLHITLNLASGRSLPPQGIIFITARAAGVTSGPPAAVKRLPIASFPITVDLTSADSMMGQQLPPKLRIEARVDSDGDPMTRDPKDPSAVADGVGLGATVSLTLK